MKNFIGQDGFVWWIGIVEDTADPLTLGRCKVRCFGYHPAKSTNLVPTKDLPWALSIHPLNTPNLYGTPRLGDWVFGFFLDAMSAQEPAILGYLPAIPEAASSYFGTASSLTRNFAKVTDRRDVLWDTDDSISISSNQSLILNGKNSLVLSDSTNDTTLNALISRIKIIEDALNIVSAVNLSWIQYSDFWNKSTSLTTDHRNWGLYRSWYGSNPDITWGVEAIAGTVPGAKTNLSGTVELKASGNGVDVVIAEPGVMDPDHPEFAVNSDGTGGSRAKYFNWFSLDTPDNPSTYGQTYNPSITTSGEIESNSNHATHVASTVAGNTQGWARNAKIYTISSQYLFDKSSNKTLFQYISAWHKQKRDSGNMRPTIVNCSFGNRYKMQYTTITSVVYRGITYTGPFTINALASYGIKVYESGIATDGTNLAGVVRIQQRIARTDVDVQECINAGVIIVASAGNESYKITTDPNDVDYNNTVTATGSNSGNPMYYSRGGSPGAASNVICVGAISNSIDSPGADRKANFSNCGPRVDVFAPGAMIAGALLTPVIMPPATTDNPIPVPNPSYPTPVPDPRNGAYYIAKNSGTSMASPQVCGILACALELNPLMNQAAALTYITQAAGVDQIPATTGGPTDVYDLQGAPNRYLSLPNNLKFGIESWVADNNIIVNAITSDGAYSFSGGRDSAD